MKLGKRLAAIAAQVDGPYQSIWDCCCDHGLLGMALLEDHTEAKIHFVDCIESITASLNKKLLSLYPLNNSYQVHCIDVFDLPLEDQNSQLAHLLIIAGVGGEFALQIIRHLLAEFSHLKLAFLVCPVRHQYLLRQWLQSQQLRLVDEVLVEENKRFYEIIHFANFPLEAQVSRRIIASGSELWLPFNTVKRRYLEKQLQHWQRVLRSTQKGSEEQRWTSAVLEDYRQLAKQYID